MPAPDPLAGTPEEFTAADWKEFVQSARPSGPNSFSARGGEAALVGIIPAIKLRGALRFCLGYNFAPFTGFGSSGLRLLYRTNPPYHPRYNQLIATSVAEEEFGPPGVSKTSGGQRTLKHQANSARDNFDAVYYSPPKITHYAGYNKARLTVRFQPINYRLAEDDDILALLGGRAYNEYARSTILDVEPRVEVLSLDGFTLKFAEGQANTAPLSNPFGNDFPAPFGQLLVKPDVTFKWLRVPRRFIISAGGPDEYPAKILKVLGKVNDDDFAGYPRGTLLLNGIKMEKYAWPLCLGQEEAFEYDVTYLMSFFDPPKGKTGDVQIVAERGHNNMPWKGTLVAGDTNAGKWFIATRTGGSGVASVDPRLLEYADFYNLFRHVDAP